MSDIIVAAIIEGVSNVLMAVIPVVALLLGGRSYLKTKKLREQHKRALSDILFLLKVEQEHAKLHKEATSKTNKRFVRSLAGVEYDWSGQFTSARIKRKLATLNSQDRKVAHITRRL